MDRKNAEVFSPIRQFDDQNIKRRSDSFSKYMKGPDVFKKNFLGSEISESIDENIPVKSSSKAFQKKTTASNVFSPIRSFDEEKSKRRSDSLSKYIKGPDEFKKTFLSSEISENINENIAINRRSNKASQKKMAKSEVHKSEESLGSSTTSYSSILTITSEENRSLKNKSENSAVASKKNKDIAINFVTKKNDKLKNQQDEIESMKAKHSSRSTKKNSVNLAKSSLQSETAVVPEASGSREIKKAVEPSSMSRRNPLSQIQSGVFEKLINNAVESRFEEIEQLMNSQHYDILKTLHITMEKMEERHASDQATMFKVIEALLEENRVLRNAILAHQ